MCFFVVFNLIPTFIWYVTHQLFFLLIPHLQKILASDWLVYSVSFFNPCNLKDPHVLLKPLLAWSSGNFSLHVTKTNTDRQLLRTFWVSLYTKNMNILNENKHSDLLICNFPESDDDSFLERKYKKIRIKIFRDSIYARGKSPFFQQKI